MLLESWKGADNHHALSPFSSNLALIPDLPHASVISTTISSDEQLLSNHQIPKPPGPTSPIIQTELPCFNYNTLHKRSPVPRQLPSRCALPLSLPLPWPPSPWPVLPLARLARAILARLNARLTCLMYAFSLHSRIPQRFHVRSDWLTLLQCPSDTTAKCIEAIIGQYVSNNQFPSSLSVSC